MGFHDRSGNIHDRGLSRVCQKLQVAIAATGGVQKGLSRPHRQWRCTCLCAAVLVPAKPPALVCIIVDSEWGPCSCSNLGSGRQLVGWFTAVGSGILRLPTPAGGCRRLTP